MASFSRLICRLVGSRKLISGNRFCIKSGAGRHGQMMMSTMARSHPWLMLPPTFEGDSRMMSYKAYNLKEKELITVRPPMVPNGNLYLKGSSHGWVALYNPGNLDLFLYNPLSCRRVMLPDVRTLPNLPKHCLKTNYGCVRKVIVSCSPDNEEDCRAMITYTSLEALAFCWPGRSKEWTPIGDHYYLDEFGKKCARGYTDLVYSDRQKLFFCLSDEYELETWDLRDPLFPRMVPLKILDDEEEEFTYETEEEENLRVFCWWVEHLVITPDDDLLIVTRYKIDHVGPDGSYVDFFDEGSECYTNLTVDFCIQKYEPEDGGLKRVDGSDLGGVAIFLGRFSDSVALSTTEFPELKPNSIYFTDSSATGSWKPEDRESGGYDIGIFNFENKTVSPCYYPCDIQSIKKITLSPFWFFP